jgi:hypothetical protein
VIYEVDIKEYARSLLMDNSIISLTGDETVYFLHADNPKGNYVEYEFYDENGALWVEGTEMGTNYYLQVDIFSKGNYSDLETAIKNKLIANGFERGMCADLYENDTHLFHKAMRFITSF